MTVRADDKEFRARVRLDTPREREYLRHGGILPYVLRQPPGELARRTHLTGLRPFGACDPSPNEGPDSKCNKRFHRHAAPRYTLVRG